MNKLKKKIMTEFGSLREFQRSMKEVAGRTRKKHANGQPMKFSYPFILNLVNHPARASWKNMRFVAKTLSMDFNELDRIIDEGQE